MNRIATVFAGLLLAFLGTSATFAGTSCPADVDGSGDVNVVDLLAVIDHWGTDGGDVNGDGTTDVLDLLSVIDTWGLCNDPVGACVHGPDSGGDCECMDGWTEAECVGESYWLGAGTSCEEAGSAELPNCNYGGPCCFYNADGQYWRCEWVHSQQECDGLGDGGFYHPGGDPHEWGCGQIECYPSPPATWGACCSGDQLDCRLVPSEDDCSAIDDVFHLGVVCGDGLCAGDAGACCYPSSDWCEEQITADECGNEGGTWMGEGTTCDSCLGSCDAGPDSGEDCFCYDGWTEEQCPHIFRRGVPCSDPVISCQQGGACCLLEQGMLVCRWMTQSDCEDSNGSYHHATNCGWGDPNVNECNPHGACCLGPNSCAIMFVADCNAVGGTYIGDGTTCDSEPCQ